MPKRTDYTLKPAIRDAMQASLGRSRATLSTAEVGIGVMMAAGMSMLEIAEVFENTTRQTAIDIFESMLSKAVAVRRCHSHQKTLENQGKYDIELPDDYDPAEASVLATLSGDDGIDEGIEYDDTDLARRIAGEGAQ